MRLVWRGATTSGTRGVSPHEKPPAGTARLQNLGALPLSSCGSKSRIFNPCWLSPSFARCAINQHDGDLWKAQFPVRASLRWPVCATPVSPAAPPRDHRTTPTLRKVSKGGQTQAFGATDQGRSGAPLMRAGRALRDGHQQTLAPELRCRPCPSFLQQRR